MAHVDATKLAILDGNLTGGAVSDPEALQAVIDDSAAVINGNYDEFNKSNWLDSTLSTHSAVSSNNGGVGQTLTNATTWYKVNLVSTRDALIEFANSRFTAKKAGIYYVNMSLFLLTVPSGTRVFLGMYLNGFLSSYAADLTGAGNAVGMNGGRAFYLNANDYIEMFVWAGTAGIQTDPNVNGTYMDIVRIA